MYGLLDALWKEKKFFFVLCFIFWLLGSVPHLHRFHSLMVFRCSFWWNLFYACVPNSAPMKSEKRFVVVSLCCSVCTFVVVAIESISTFVNDNNYYYYYYTVRHNTIMALLLISRYHQFHSFLHWRIHFPFGRWKILIHRSIAFVCQWLK